MEEESKNIKKPETGKPFESLGQLQDYNARQRNNPETKYFFDTYAIIEIIKNNQNYIDYMEEEATITLFNLAEIYYKVLNEYNEEKADTIYKNYKDAVEEIDEETFKDALRFRKDHKKRDLSYADCIGYIYAKRHNMKFLTGDEQFKDLENMEFVK